MVHGKIAWDGTKWGQEVFFPTNSDIANVLGRTDLDFKKFHVFPFFGSHISGFSGSQISKNLAWAGPGLGLGPGGPSGGPGEPSGGSSGGPAAQA